MSASALVPLQRDGYNWRTVNGWHFWMFENETLVERLNRILAEQSTDTEPPPTKVEGFSGLERLRRTVGSFPTEVGGFKPDFWKMNKDVI